MYTCWFFSSFGWFVVCSLEQLSWFVEWPCGPCPRRGGRMLKEGSYWRDDPMGLGLAGVSGLGTSSDLFMEGLLGGTVGGAGGGSCWGLFWWLTGGRGGAPFLQTGRVEGLGGRVTAGLVLRDGMVETGMWGFCGGMGGLGLLGACASFSAEGLGRCEAKGSGGGGPLMGGSRGGGRLRTGSGRFLVGAGGMGGGGPLEKETEFLDRGGALLECAGTGGGGYDGGGTVGRSGRQKHFLKCWSVHLNWSTSANRKFHQYFLYISTLPLMPQRSEGDTVL